MKIAIISPWTVSNTAVGGTERFVLDLANSLNNLGNEVDIYMLSGKTETIDNINFINLNLLGNGNHMDEYKLSEMFGDFSFDKTYENIAKTLEEKIDGNKYDLIQLNSQLFLKAFRKTNRVFTIHTNPFEYKLGFGDNSFEKMLEILKEEALNNKTCFVTPSLFYANEYNKLTGVNIQTIPHAIDISRLKCNKTKDEICTMYNLNPNSYKILLPSRLEPIRKQPMLFMKAFAQQPESIKNKFQVICTGADKQYLMYKEEIEEFCSKSNIDLKIIRFDKMGEAYKIADIVALPSQSESFGYSALESLSLGIPTIINSIPTYMEIVNGSNNAFVFDNDVMSLSEQLTVLYNKGLERKKQSIAWQEQYDILKFGEKYLYLFYKR